MFNSEHLTKDKSMTDYIKIMINNKETQETLYCEVLESRYDRYYAGRNVLTGESCYFDAEMWDVCIEAVSKYEIAEVLAAGSLRPVQYVAKIGTICGGTWAKSDTIRKALHNAINYADWGTIDLMIKKGLFNGSGHEVKLFKITGWSAFIGDSLHSMGDTVTKMYGLKIRNDGKTKFNNLYKLQCRDWYDYLKIPTHDIFDTDDLYEEIFESGKLRTF